MATWMTATEHRQGLAKAKRGERRMRQRLERRLAAARRDRKRQRMEAVRCRNSARDLRAENAGLKGENERQRALWSARRRGVPWGDAGDAPAGRGAPRAHFGEVLDAILRDGDLTREVSGLSREKFDFVLCRFAERAGSGRGRFPLFYGAKGRGSRPGPRMLLPLRHQLLMALASKTGGASQYLLGAMFGISRPTVARCLAFADTILEAVLPTGDRVWRKLSRAKTRRELGQLVTGPGLGVLVVDSIRTRRQVPKDKDERSASLAGWFGTHSYATLACASRRGAILWLGETRHGGTSDRDALGGGKPGFGRWTAGLRAGRIAPGGRLTLILDLGFPGAEGMYPGQRVVSPAGRRRGGGRGKSGRNRRGSRGARAEHGIGECGRFGLFRTPFRGANKKYRRQLNIISGIANLHILWPTMRRDAWIGEKL